MTELKLLFVTMFAVLTGKYWRPSWALERAKLLLDKGDDKGYWYTCTALEAATAVDPATALRARDYLKMSIGYKRTLFDHLVAMGWMSTEMAKGGLTQAMKDPGYHALRERWINDLIVELKKQGR